jgi:glutamate-1-semialdehyde aminotransferase
VTGLGSLFAVNFNESAVNDYRSFIQRDTLLGRIFFLGLLNQGILWQTKNAGALNILSSSKEVDEFILASSEIGKKIKNS